MQKPGQASKPVGSEADEFEQLFLKGDYDGCREFLEHSPRTDANAIRAARLDHRGGRFVDAVERLTALAPSGAKDRIDRDLCLAGSYACTKDFSSAARLLDRVLARVQAPDPAYYEALYRKAHMAWVLRDPSSAESLVRPVLKSPDGNQRALARVLLSWAYGSRGSVQRQIGQLLRALDEFDSAPAADAYLRLNALYALAIYARELPRDDIAARVRAEYDALRPAGGTRVDYFKLTRVMGWIDAVRGDELAAFKRFRAAADLAPTDQWRVLCMTDRAYLARATGERAFALDQLYASHEMASRLSWNDTAQDDRLALLTLAELFANEDPALAQRYLALFRSLRTPMDPRIGLAGDLGVRAYENYSAGIALLYLFERGDATEMLRSAWETFEQFGFALRSAQCALALYQATGERRWATLARKRVEPWPNSWVARDVLKSVPLVSPAQRPVLDLVLQGKRNAEIAAALGRSPNTVRNHIAEIFKAFGVRSRSELIARFARRTHP